MTFKHFPACVQQIYSKLYTKIKIIMPSECDLSISAGLNLLAVVPQVADVFGALEGETLSADPVNAKDSTTSFPLRALLMDG